MYLYMETQDMYSSDKESEHSEQSDFYYDSVIFSTEIPLLPYKQSGRCMSKTIKYYSGFTRINIVLNLFLIAMSLYINKNTIKDMVKMDYLTMHF